MRLFLFSFFLLPVLVFARLNDNGDFQIWDHHYLDFKVNEEFHLHLAAEFRWGDDSSKLYVKYGEILFIYRPLKWLEIVPGYRHLYVRFLRDDFKWKLIYSPLFDLLFYFPVAPWGLSDRSRVQYLIIEGRDNRWVYRNRIHLTFPYSDYYVNPFIDNEFFWTEGRGFDQNRLRSGLEVNFSEHVKGRLFYMLRYLKVSDGWNYQNVLVTQLNFQF